MRWLGEGDEATQAAVALMVDIAKAYIAGEVVHAKLYKIRDDKLVERRAGPKAEVCHEHMYAWSFCLKANLFSIICFASYFSFIKIYRILSISS